MPKLFSSMSKMSPASLTRDSDQPGAGHRVGPHARFTEGRADHDAAHGGRDVAVGDAEDQAVVFIEQVGRDAAVEFDADDAV